MGPARTRAYETSARGGGERGWPPAIGVALTILLAMAGSSFHAIGEPAENFGAAGWPSLKRTDQAATEVLQTPSSATGSRRLRATRPGETRGTSRAVRVVRALLRPYYPPLVKPRKPSQASLVVRPGALRFWLRPPAPGPDRGWAAGRLPDAHPIAPRATRGLSLIGCDPKSVPRRAPNLFIC